MVDKNGTICEYDDYDIPSAPKVVTPEMLRRKEELLIEFKKFVEEVNSTENND